MKSNAIIAKDFLIWFLLSLFWVPSWCCVTHALSLNSSQEFNIGFSRALFTNVNDNDAKASIKVWSQTVARERNIMVNSNAQLFDSAVEMAAALKSGSADAMGMAFEEYVAVSEVVETDHWFLTKMAGNLHEEYVILTQDTTGVDFYRML